MNSLLSLKRILLSFSLVVLVGGCSILSGNKIDNSTRYFSLLKIPNEMIGLINLEKFEFVGVVERSMLVQSELTSTHINLVAMTFEGLPIVQASWSALDNTWQVMAGVAFLLEPSQILHDLQSVHWPLSTIEDALFEHYYVVEGVNNFGVRFRAFYFNDELIRVIDYKKDMIEFNDFRKNYQLNITPLNSGTP